MKSLFSILLVSAITCGSTASVFAGQLPTPKFVNEDGQVTVLNSGATVPVTEVGGVAWQFSFQSSLFDASLGVYEEPDYVACYANQHQTLTSSDYVSAGIPILYGRDHAWAKVTNLSFDAQTGIGTAEAYLPFRLVTKSSSWSSLLQGTNVIDLYWGTPVQVAHGDYLPPTNYEGTDQISIEGVVPPLAVAFTENRNMQVGKATTGFVLVDSPTVNDRVYSLSVPVPGAVQLPAPVTILANETSVAFTMVPLAEGQARVTAVEVASSLSADSQIADVSQAVSTLEVSTWPVYTPVPDGVISLNSRCNPARVDGPTQPTGATEVSCGSCSFSVPQPKDCAGPNGIVGGDHGFYKSFYCSWFSLTSTCYTQPLGISLTLQVWSFDSFYAVPCGGILRWAQELANGASNSYQRMCCVYSAKDQTKTGTAPNCRS